MGARDQERGRKMNIKVSRSSAAREGEGVFRLLAGLAASVGLVNTQG